MFLLLERNHAHLIQTNYMLLCTPKFVRCCFFTFDGVTLGIAMGTFGLWKYVAAHNVQYAADKKVGGGVDHMFLDMNGLMHMSYSKASPTSATTMKNLKSLIQKLLNLYNPTKSLIVVFDGPAPTAKLRTQRERRQSMLKNSESMELNEAQIVTGSPFVLDCEKEIIEMLRIGAAQKKLCGVEIDGMLVLRVNGSTVPGEGEIKIGEELRRLPYVAGAYDPDDRVVVVGNDSDLILTCIACTPYHNFFVVNPFTFVATHVGELMTHWTNVDSVRKLPLELLPSFRLDFVFLALLAGGDHYPGIEDDWLQLWRRYRKLRLDGGFFRQSLVTRDSKGETQLHWELFRAVAARDHGVMQHYVGSKNKRKTVKAQGSTTAPESGIQLLKDVRWSFDMVSGQPCSDYYHHHRGEAPRLSSLRSALGSKGVNGQSAVVHSTVPPLLPLQVYVAVIGVSRLLPVAIRNSIDSTTLKAFEQTLSVGKILSSVEEFFKVLRLDQLSNVEKLALKFGDICDVIALDPTLDVVSSRSFFSYPVDVNQISFKNLYDSRGVRLMRIRPVADAAVPVVEPIPGIADEVVSSSDEVVETC